MIPLSYFEISNAEVKDSVITTVYLWNKGFQIIRRLAHGEDWSAFFKVNKLQKKKAKMPFFLF